MPIERDEEKRQQRIDEDDRVKNYSEGESDDDDLPERPVNENKPYDKRN